MQIEVSLQELQEQVPSLLVTLKMERRQESVFLLEQERLSVEIAEE